MPNKCNSHRRQKTLYFFVSDKVLTYTNKKSFLELSIQAEKIVWINLYIQNFNATPNLYKFKYPTNYFMVFFYSIEFIISLNITLYQNTKPSRMLTPLF